MIESIGYDLGKYSSTIIWCCLFFPQKEVSVQKFKINSAVESCLTLHEIWLCNVNRTVEISINSV
jgi:hypothetical protein